jgi:nucleoside 2-deoxyribosyltransferase
VSKKYYLSTRKDRSNEAASLEQVLKSVGWERTYTWTDLGSCDSDAYATAALAELEGVRSADVLIVLLPGGFGTHVEIGAALALGKPVILHSPDRKTLETPYPCIFHYHPKVSLIISDAIDISQILSLADSRLH